MYKACGIITINNTLLQELYDEFKFTIDIIPLKRIVHFELKLNK